LYRGVTSTGEPYISEAYTTAATGNERIVAAASYVTPPDDRHKVLGIFVAGYSIDTIQAYVDRLARAQDLRLTVTDQRGVVVAAPGAMQSGLDFRTDDPRVKAALQGRDGVTEIGPEDGRLLSAYAPVAEGDGR
jgi:hypothetical protein